MQGLNRQELYKSFIHFIAEDIQKERNRVNRRMLNVFFWCFFLPVLMSIILLILVKLRVIPRTFRNYLDWLILVVPIFYSIYILSIEVLAQVPGLFRRGGGAAMLEQPLKEGLWRERVSEEMARLIPASADQWEWVIASFKMDLQAMQNRTKYLTALAGAVFFLLMQGIDSLMDGEEKMTWVKTSLLGWVETSSNDFSQFVGLGLFLLLFYLSGNQAYQTLNRYLNCAELIKGKH